LNITGIYYLIYFMIYMREMKKYSDS
jgi:hypothetical protein